MHLLKLTNRVINLEHVAIVHRHGPGSVTVQYSIPETIIIADITGVPGGTVPAATGHFAEHLKGAEADELWAKVQEMP